MTYAITLVGKPTIPGAQTFAEYRPLEVSGTVATSGSLVVEGPWGTPLVATGVPNLHHVTLSTPLPGGNIAARDDRWDYIVHDTLPAYQHLLATDPAEARRIIASPFAERMEESRLLNRLGEIERDLLTNWGVGVESWQ